jgi:hypothetical protein
MCVALRPDSHANPDLIASARSYPAALFVSIVAIGLSLRFYWVISKYSVNLFFFDEWDIYAPLFEHARWWQVFFTQHGPHREGVGVVVVSWLLTFAHWNSRVQAFAIGTAIVLAMVLAIGLKVRVFGRLIISDAIIPAMFLGLGQWEVLVSGPGPSAQAIPLLLIMAYCLAWLQECCLLRYALVIVINFLLVYTGYGVFITGITLALLALDVFHHLPAGDVRGATASFLAFTIAAASLASFFYHYVFNPAADCYHFPYRNPAAYPWFMSLMFARFVGIKHGLLFGSVVGIGAVVLVVALMVDHAWLLTRDRPPQRASLVIFILTGYTLIYASAAAVGRVCLGMHAAQSSRNMTLLIPAFLGIYFHLLAKPSGGKRTLLLAIMFLIVLPSAIQRYHKELEGLSAMKRDWKQCYLEREDIQLCDQATGLQIYPWPEKIRLKEKLAYLKQNALNLYATDK